MDPLYVKHLHVTYPPRIGFFVGAVGTPVRGIFGLPTATATPPPIASTFWGLGFAGRILEFLVPLVT